ncbi:MAG: serine protease [Candidatus Absconditabacteria bacterium]|nr:serine protease [Candidatus Absconditabacteria bacterium]
MSKKTKKKVLSHKVIPKMPTKFSNFVDCVDWVKKSTYLIVRGNPKKDGIQWETLGTGVIVSEGRMITCSHVINGGKGHKDGSLYYFVRHDDLDHRHTSIFNLNIGKNLFIYEKFDLSIIYLEKEFYQSGEKIFKLPNEYVKINKEPQFIGTDIGILGYPYCKLEFMDGDMQKPNIGNIILRTDKGVINGRYRLGKDAVIYNEFTIQFNKGNSGGPIFNTKDGTLIGLVKGYKRILSDIKPIAIDQQMPDGSKKKLGAFDINTSYYSIGVPVENYLDILKEHKIIN